MFLLLFGGYSCYGFLLVTFVKPRIGGSEIRRMENIYLKLVLFKSLKYINLDSKKNGEDNVNMNSLW